jgi:small-conductance mechanosensitive channel
VQNWTFYGNPPRAWITALVVLAVIAGVLLIARRVLHQRLAPLAARTSTDLDDFVIELLRRTHALFLVLVALSAASLALALPDTARVGIHMALVTGLIVQMAFWGNELIVFWTRRLALAQNGTTAQGTVAAMTFAGRVLLWVVLLLLLLDNFGLHITTLVATLGVGGIAVALAAQSVLGDFLAAVSIYLDKPFVIGDFIIFDEFLGSVQYVGLRSTRIQSLYGEQVIISNSDLLKTRIRNYKQMTERRVTFQIGAAYGTPADTVARIPVIIREAVEAQARVRFDRSHFKGFGDSSLDFETVFYVLSPDYNVFMDILQAIHLVILRRFEADGIAFAHPIRMVTMAGGEAAPPRADVARGDATPA